MALVALLWATGWLGAAEQPVPEGKTAVTDSARVSPAGPAKEGHFQFFGPLLDSQKYPTAEQVALIAVLLIAVAGLVYARHVGQAGAGGRPGHGADAGDRRAPCARGPTPIWVPKPARSCR